MQKMNMNLLLDQNVLLTTELLSSNPKYFKFMQLSQNSTT